MSSKVQANMDSDLKKADEDIVKAGLSLKQKTALELRKISKKVPIREINSKQDFEEFFNEN